MYKPYETSFRAQRMSIKEKLMNISFWYVFCICLLAAAGTVMLYSAANGHWSPWAMKQLVRFGFGLGVMVVLALMDIRWLIRYAYVFYIFALVLLLIVEVTGHIGMGAQRWINLGFIKIQPSELMKIALVMALAPLHRRYGIRRTVVSTYQSVSGSGMKGLEQLHCEQRGEHYDNPAYPHQIHENVIPQGGSFLDNGYTTEEDKLIFETNKILHSDIAVTATVVRVPVYGGHSESVNIEFEQPYDLEDAIATLKAMPGIVICDDPTECLYPMPVTAYDKDEVFVGRIRRDFSTENGLNLWLCSDNIRKGAATNAVQIAKYIIDKSLV